MRAFAATSHNSFSSPHPLNKSPLGDGAAGFDKNYWEANYHHPEMMEGIANASEYVRYAKSFFDLEEHPIESICDLGFGLGLLFREFLYVFQPDKALGIDPSPLAVKAAKALDLDPYNRIDVKLKKLDLLSWCRGSIEDWEYFDLGICTSVFQYLQDEELEEIIPILAERFEYLYLTVPTDIELKRQITQVGFHDEYAIHRSRSWYQRLLKKHFTFISNRILESKLYHKDMDTPFTDLLFRF